MDFFPRFSSLCEYPNIIVLNYVNNKNTYFLFYFIFFRVDGANPSTPFTKTICVDEEGPPVDFCFRETGAYPLIVYATAFGSIVGLDHRSNTPAFRLENDLLEGLQTSISMSPDQSWLVNGTSSGNITCWDLRFQLPIGNYGLVYITN